jgi:hypothetical protein
MTTQTVNIDAFGYSGTFGAKLRDPDTIATLVATADTVVASGTIASRFVCTFGEVAVIAAGVYLLEFVVNGVSSILYVTLTGVDGEVALARLERAAALDSATAAQIAAILEDTGTTLPAQIAGISAGSGTGARTVTITVNDGTTVLQNATVRMTEGANTYTATTNVSGVAVFNLDDATYTVGVTKSGYSYAGTTLVVNGTETATYSMTVTTITPPSNPSLSAIVVLCLNAAGQPEASVAIDIRIVTVPSGSQNIAYKGSKQTATSNVNGIAQFEVVQGSVCEWKRGKADVWSSVTIDSDSVTNVTSVIGSP